MASGRYDPPRLRVKNCRGAELLDDLAAWECLHAGDNSEQIGRLLRNMRRARESELTERQAEMLHLYYDLGMSIPRIARERGLQKSSVSRTLERGRKRLKRYLQYSW